MKVDFKNSLPKAALKVHQILTEAGFEAFLVGGCVRDFLLKRKIGDYDFTTNATPEEVTDLFTKVIPTGIKHGTVTVLENNQPFEVTTYRTDGKYTDNRRPDKVSYAKTLKEDVMRRDFTINALAYDIKSEGIIDYYKGMDDLKNLTIRTIGEAKERFSEDALRMLRACRFASQLGFEIEDQTKKAILELKDNLNNISSERIRDEFIKIIQSKKPSVGFENMRITGLLSIVIPEVELGYGVDQNKYHKYDVYYHTMHVLDAVKNEDYRLRMSALLHDVAKPVVKKKVSGKQEEVFYNHEHVGAGMTRRLMKRLKFSNDDIKLVTHLVREHMFHYTPSWTDGAVRRFIKKIQVEHLPFLFQLREADRIGNGYRTPDCAELVEFRARIKEILEKDSALSLKDLAIRGADLMQELSIPPTKELGNILKHLLEKVIDEPNLNEKEKLLELAKEYHLSLKANT